MDTSIISQSRNMAAREARIKDTVKQYQKRLFSFIRDRVPTLEDAEDIIQDVWYQFTRALAQPIEEEQGWLFRVARNRITDFHRKKKNIAISDKAIMTDEEDGPLFLDDILPDAAPRPDEAFSLSLIPEAIEAGLAELPAEQRQVFMWHEVEGKSFKEMAEMTGLPVNTLISRKRYAIVFLREYLRELYNDLNN